jgi:membrane protease YdiL (CAAX protease family)
MTKTTVVIELIEECAVHIWDRSKALVFAISVCAIYWTLSIAGSFGPQIKFALPSLQFAVGSKFVLLMGASLVPAIICVVMYPECRSSLQKVNAHWAVYLVAIASGLVLPLLSYFGSHYPVFPWGRPVAMTLFRVFVLNLCLSPLWEEIVWRGCFLKKVRSFSSASGGILVSSIGWTIWHGGFIAYLYSEGIPMEVLSVLPFVYFCSGIILGSVFEMGHGSLWPCVLLHAGFDASTLVYYQSYDRAFELSSYIAELIFAAIAAGLLFRIATRRNRVLFSAANSG